MDPVRGHIEGGGHPLQVISFMGKRKGQQVTQKSIKKEDKDDDEQGQSNGSPGRLKHEEKRQEAEQDIPFRRNPNALDEIPIFNQDIQSN